MGDNLNTSSPWLRLGFDVSQLKNYAYFLDFFFANSCEIHSSEAVKHKVETHSLVARQPLPVNSIDVVSYPYE